MPLDKRTSIKRVSDEFLGVYALYRERVSQEDQLVNHRMGWMLWSNSIFFAFFAAISSALSGKPKLDPILRFSDAPIVIIIIGIVCTLGGTFSIAAALGEIEHLRVIYYERYPEIRQAEAEGLMPSIVGHRNSHLVGKLVPWLIPLSIILLWVALLIEATFQPR